MAKQPSCALKDEDIDALFKLNEETDDFHKRVPEVVAYLRHLENSYPIKTFLIGNYRPKDYEGNKAIPPFHIPDYFHAAKAYVSLYLWLLLVGVSESDAEQYKGKFNDYCWHEIDRIEKETTTDEDGLTIRVNVLYYLELLVDVAIRLKDVPVIVRAFTKLFDYTGFMGKLDSWVSLANGQTRRLTRPFEGFVNETLGMLNSSEDVFVKHPKLIQSYIKAISYAFDDEPCLILGETGTGKELIAKTIHAFSQRKDNHFRAVNCGGFTESLFNAEIQGVVAGTTADVITRLGVFLKATGKRDGLTDYGYLIDKQKIKFRSLEGKLFERPYDVTDELVQSVGGTVFLDEVNSLDISQQAAFLRIVQEKEVNVIGEDFSRKFFAKLVCASNSDLHELILKRKFRSDLYYRIAKGIVEVPPLRDLRECFEEIITNQVDNICKRIRTEKRINVPVSTLRKLKKHHWPGNFRELDGTLYRALKKADLDNSTSLKPSYFEYESVPTKAEDIRDYGGMQFEPLISDYMKYLYRISEGHQTKAAEIAGMKRNRLRDHWIKFGIIEAKPQSKRVQTNDEVHSNEV